MTNDLTTMRRDDVLKRAASIKEGLNEIAAAVERAIHSGAGNDESLASMARKIQHATLWGLANLNLDDLTRTVVLYERAANAEEKD